MQLPHDYVARMQQMLGQGEDSQAFLDSYEEPRTYGLRLNPLKLNPASDAAKSLCQGFALSPVSWCPGGYYYEAGERPGKHPYHAAGLYYIQEPSAMAAVQCLAPEPGDIVLDLAAAPGGKSTQIAGLLQGQGLLIANEIHPGRAKILAENIERMGVANAVVTCATPQELSRRFPGFFDKIMLDAPCSGEGMFRKDPEAIAQWSEASVAMCAARQKEIIDEAVKMLRPGGSLGYSTCTFNVQENEQAIQYITDRYPEFTVERMERLWPHHSKGEGHFIAVLRKAGDLEQEPGGPGRGSSSGAGRRTSSGTQGGAFRGAAGRNAPKLNSRTAEAMEAYRSFAAQRLPGFQLPPGEPLLFGEQLYWFPASPRSWLGAQDLAGLKTLRPGLHLAELKKNRLEPAHALALAVSMEHGAASLQLPVAGPDILAYLKGATLQTELGNGWTLVGVDGYAVGWGKISGGTVKNHIPKGLRWLG